MSPSGVSTMKRLFFTTQRTTRSCHQPGSSAYVTSMRRPGKPSVTGLCRPEDTIRGRGTRAIESDDVTPQRRGLRCRAAAAAEAQAGEQADEDEQAAPTAKLPLRHRPECGGVADRNQRWLRLARRAGDLLRGVVGARCTRSNTKRSQYHPAVEAATPPPTARV